MERTKINLEYIFRASPKIIYNFLTTPACLVRWFCDSVDINGETYSFVWDDFAEIANLTDHVEDERAHFEWEEKDEGEFLEFRLSTSPVTSETIMEITDFCDADEVSDYKNLWDSQIRDLRKEMGEA